MPPRHTAAYYLDLLSDVTRARQAHSKEGDDLDAERLNLYCRARLAEDPPASWASIGQAAGGISDVGVLRAVQAAARNGNALARKALAAGKRPKVPVAKEANSG